MSYINKNPLIICICGKARSGKSTVSSYLEKLFFSNSNRLSLTIAFVLMTIALAESSFTLSVSLNNNLDYANIKISFSSLLVCMMLGTVFCNLSEYSVDIMSRSEKWSAPLYAVFFVLSDETTKLNAHKLEYQIHRMIKNAYDASEILEKADDVKAPMNFAGCSVENMDGAWYLVCNLNELTEGREEEVEIILEVEQDFDAQGNTISELKIYYCIQWFKSELVIFPLHELLEFPRHKDLNNL